MTGLLAVVANSALGLTALLGHMAHGTAVVALLADSAVLGKVTLATARVAALGSAKLGAGTGSATGSGGTAGNVSASSGKVTGLSALVAGAGGGASGSTELTTNGSLGGGSTALDNGVVLGALLQDVTGLVALEASLLLGLLSAVSGHVAVVATVVADGVTHTGASSHLVTEFTA